MFRAARGGWIPGLASAFEEDPGSMNWANSDGDTPLITASFNGQVTAVDFLLRHGANPRKRDAGNRAPLHVLLLLGACLGGAAGFDVGHVTQLQGF